MINSSAKIVTVTTNRMAALVANLRRALLVARLYTSLRPGTQSAQYGARNNRRSSLIILFVFLNMFFCVYTYILDSIDVVVIVVNSLYFYNVFVVLCQCLCFNPYTH
jgi:hypothetical protein